jgi:2'-5' RNA ligase
MTDRLFVAVRPPTGALEDLEDYVGPRRHRDDPLRWSPASRWHLTLAFLPAVQDRTYDALVDNLSAAGTRRSAFSLQIVRAGAFPNPAAAQVLWAGVDGDLERLSRLATAARTAAATAGATVDGQRFRPHLTLARLRPRADVTRWLRVLDLYSGPSWPVTEMILIRSVAGGVRGPGYRHQPVQSFPLGRG